MGRPIEPNSKRSRAKERVRLREIARKAAEDPVVSSSGSASMAPAILPTIVGNEHEKTPYSSDLVERLSSYGIASLDIAREIGVSVDTLVVHYQAELARGMPRANAKVAESLFKMATEQKVVAAAIWWTKSRMGWREPSALDFAPGGSGTYVLEVRRGPRTVDEDGNDT